MFRKTMTDEFRELTIVEATAEEEKVSAEVKIIIEEGGHSSTAVFRSKVQLEQLISMLEEAKAVLK